MAATGRFRNTKPVTWTPAGGGAVTFTGIKSVNYDEGNQILEESADADAFVTTGGVILSNPKVDITSINAGQINATVAGAKGTLAYTLLDHSNGIAAGGGALTYTLSNAYLGPRTESAPFNQLATQTLTFHSTSTDGVTHPMGVAPV